MLSLLQWPGAWCGAQPEPFQEQRRLAFQGTNVWSLGHRAAQDRRGLSQCWPRCSHLGSGVGPSLKSVSCSKETAHEVRLTEQMGHGGNLGLARCCQP